MFSHLFKAPLQFFHTIPAAISFVETAGQQPITCILGGFIAVIVLKRLGPILLRTYKMEMPKQGARVEYTLVKDKIDRCSLTNGIRIQRGNLPLKAKYSTTVVGYPG